MPSAELVNRSSHSHRTGYRAQPGQHGSGSPEPPMDFDNLDAWVWAKRFQEPDWPRDPKTNIPLHVEVPVELPEGKCVLKDYCEKPSYSRNYCCGHYSHLKRSEKKEHLDLRYRTTKRRKKCKTNGCWNKTDHYVDYCRHCFYVRSTYGLDADTKIDRRKLPRIPDGDRRPYKERYNAKRRARTEARIAERKARLKAMDDYARLVDPDWFANRPKTDTKLALHNENQKRIAAGAAEMCAKLEAALSRVDRTTFNDDINQSIDLRLKYPHDSLRQLAERADPPMSKHQLQGNLRRFLAKS